MSDICMNKYQAKVDGVYGMVFLGLLGLFGFRGGTGMRKRLLV